MFGMPSHSARVHQAMEFDIDWPCGAEVDNFALLMLDIVSDLVDD